MKHIQIVSEAEQKLIALQKEKEKVHVYVCCRTNTDLPRDPLITNTTSYLQLAFSTVLYSTTVHVDHHAMPYYIIFIYYVA